jgi:hypothetical protein
VLAFGRGIIEENDSGIVVSRGELGLLSTIDPEIQIVMTRIAHFESQIAASKTDIDIDSTPIECDCPIGDFGHTAHHTNGRRRDRRGCQRGLGSRFGLLASKK